MKSKYFNVLNLLSEILIENKNGEIEKVKAKIKEIEQHIEKKGISK